MLLAVEVVHRLDEPHAAHLKEVVGILAPALEALDHREDQPQVALDELLPGLPVPGPAPAQQRLRLPRLQRPQLRGVHPADLYLLHTCLRVLMIPPYYAPDAGNHAK